MLLIWNNLTIRNATPEDAGQLAEWWNDGAVMAHAGFPYGTGQTAEEIAASLKQDTEKTGRRLILELDKTSIGEMNYRRVGETTAEIGIKICDASRQEKGLGKLFLSMLLRALYEEKGYESIVLDTNVKNKRAQHVYERLGFRKVCVRENAWKDQLGEWQSSVEYECKKEEFVDFTCLSEEKA